MIPSKPRPRQVLLDKPNRWLHVVWRNGHKSIYPFAELRYHCPCATCQKQAEDAGPIQIQQTPLGDSNMLLEIIQAGTYALQFVWGDGHGTGFYAFDYLRDLCRCEFCRATEEQTGDP